MDPICKHPNCGMPRSEHRSDEEWEQHRTDASRYKHPHFAIGLVVDVRLGAKPVGWHPSMGEFYEDRPIYRSISDVDAEGNVDVGGWYWAPTDVVVR